MTVQHGDICFCLGRYDIFRNVYIGALWVEVFQCWVRFMWETSETHHWGMASINPFMAMLGRVYCWIYHINFKWCSQSSAPRGRSPASSLDTGEVVFLQTSLGFAWLVVYLPLWILPKIWKIIKFHGSSQHQPAIDSPSTGFPIGTINHQKISSTQHLQASCPPSRHRLGPPEIHSQLPQHTIISPSKQKDANKHPWIWAEFFTSWFLHLPTELSPFIILGGSS